MTSFASLMAISATHTRESQQAVENALQERRRKEALQRKQQEEKEAKERELEKQRRLKVFEEEKRRKEREERREAEQKARESALQRREKEQQDALRYGPKKAAKMASASGSGDSPKYPSSSSSNRDPVRKRRMNDSDDESPSGGIVFTREELRERKLQAEMRKQFKSSRKATYTAGYTKAGQRLPGGAVNIVIDPLAPPEVLPEGISLKERLVHGQNTLKKLQTKKTDKRSVDEAHMDAKIKLGKVTGKMLSGEDAKNYDSWFSDSRSKRAAKTSPAPASAASTPVPGADSASRKAPTPAPAPSTSVTSMQKKASTISRPTSTKPIPTTSKTSAVASRASSSDKPIPSSSSSNKQPKTNKPTTSSSASQRPSSSTTYSQSKSKRPRSPSLSESPPPKKRHLHEGHLDKKMSSTIWKLFGKERSDYISKHVLSDDEDMEADADALEREEHISARIAKREEMQALEEERRHEEEKRRRKKERERAPARGY